MRDLCRDLQFGLRLYAGRPAWTTVAILTLALGIGVNGAMFSVVNGLLFRGPNLGDPESLVWCFTRSPGNPYDTTTYADYLDFRNRNTVLERLAAEEPMPLGETTQAGQAEPLWALVVSENYFSVLGIQVRLGRAFTEEELHVEGADPPVILGHRFWKRRFSGAHDVIGRTIILSGKHYLVTGVAPRGFRSTSSLFSPDIWIPMTSRTDLYPETQYLNRDKGRLNLIGRLKDGATLSQAQSNFLTIAADLAQAHPVTNKDRSVLLAPVSRGHPEGRAALVRLSAFSMSVVFVVLLTACFNVTNLLLAHATERQKEMSIRSALGASRFRLLRQFLCESLLLAVPGGAVGLMLGAWSTSLLHAFGPPAPIPQQIDLSLDARIVCFVLALSFLAGIFPGIASAWQASRMELLPALGGEAFLFGRARRISHLRSILVTAQIAGSLILLTCAGLLLRSWHNYSHSDPGFASRNALVATLRPQLQGYDPQREALFYHQLLERVEALPPVRSATVTDRIPLGIGGSRTPVATSGEDCSQEECPEVWTYSIGPRYFETLGIPLLLGKGFESAGPTGKNQVVVSKAMAERFWPTASPVGKWLELGTEGRRVQVAAVARDVRVRALSESPQPCIYQAVESTGYAASMVLVVRAADNPFNLITSIKDQVGALDHNMPVFELKSMAEHLRTALWAPRTAALFVGVFGWMALILTTAGYFGIIAYAVSRRKREFAVRIALGAQAYEIQTLVLWHGMKLVTAGIGTGLVGAVLLAKMMSRALFGLSPLDPVTFAATILLLGGMGLFACAVPAFRVARIDPMAALRRE